MPIRPQKLEIVPKSHPFLPEKRAFCSLLKVLPSLTGPDITPPGQKPLNAPPHLLPPRNHQLPPQQRRRISHGHEIGADKIDRVGSGCVPGGRRQPGLACRDDVRGGDRGFVSVLVEEID